MIETFRSCVLYSLKPEISVTGIFGVFISPRASRKVAYDRGNNPHERVGIW